MHCKVDGKLFAAAIDRQKRDISFPFRAILAGFTRNSEAVFSVLVVPADI